MTVDALINELTVALKLPAKDAEGNPVGWRLDDQVIGRMLEARRTLRESGVEDGHRLSLLREVTAGCFSHGSYVSGVSALARPISLLMSPIHSSRMKM
jgi:hypothetical protein